MQIRSSELHQRIGFTLVSSTKKNKNKKITNKQKTKRDKSPENNSQTLCLELQDTLPFLDIQSFHLPVGILFTCTNGSNRHDGSK